MSREKYSRSELEKKPYFELKRMCEEFGLIGYYSGDRYTSATLIQMLLDYSGSTDEAAETVEADQVIKDKYTRQELEKKSYKEIAFICDKLGIIDKANSWRFDFASMIQKILDFQDAKDKLSEKPVQASASVSKGNDNKSKFYTKEDLESKSYEFLKKLCIELKIIPANRSAYTLFFNENEANKKKIIDLIIEYATAMEANGELNIDEIVKDNPPQKESTITPSQANTAEKGKENKPQTSEPKPNKPSAPEVENKKPAKTLNNANSKKETAQIENKPTQAPVIPESEKPKNSKPAEPSPVKTAQIETEKAPAAKPEETVISGSEFFNDKFDDSNLYVESNDSERYDRVNKFFKAIPSLNLTDEIKVAAKINLYDGLDVVPRDKYAIETALTISDKLVLLLNGESSLCGILRLHKDLENTDSNINRYFLKAFKADLTINDLEHKGFSLIFFNDKYDSFLSKIFNKSFEGKIPSDLAVYKAVVDVNIKKLEETQAVLCIDFGMSNTTAGCYLDENYVSEISNNDILNKNIIKNDVNLVKFLDFANDEMNVPEIMPTIVYVKSCKNNTIKYLFGYEAKDEIKRMNFCPDASVFYGIKRWVTCLDEDEVINDEKGNIAHVMHRALLREYLLSVIKYAQQQFKCKFKNLHISSPVKLKSQFLEAFTELLPEYNVERQYALDEGVSVLYNIIADKLKSGNDIDNNESKALIIDCGGGTTDLVSCLFKVTEGPFAYDVDITTSFENGDTNFGGNNITYRIMQFMKVIFANYYANSNEKIDIDDLIPIPTNEIFRNVDEAKGTESVYADFEASYNKAEAIIPTKFMEYENRTKSEYTKVKNNFYFLWELSEEMKKQFFKKTTILRNKFDNYHDLNKDDDLNITRLEKWNLNIYKEGKLTQVSDFPKIVFNIKEINKLIMADIYNIIRKFLENLYDRKELTSYDIIKLTGQSCKIGIFKEALKEFVPGRSIKYEIGSSILKRDYQDKNYSYQDTMELKLSCLKGVIRYFQSKKQGDIEVNLANEIPAIPYCLTVFDYKGNEVILIDRQTKANKAKGSIPKPLSTTEVDFYLKNNSGKEAQVIKVYKFINNPTEFEETTIEGISSETNGMILEDDIAKIANKSISFFAYADDNSWGFYVIPICKKGEDQRIYLGKKQHFAFEEDLSTVYFFDGNK